MAGSIKCPARPAKLRSRLWDAEAFSVFGYVARNQSTIETPRMIVPARFRNNAERSHICMKTDFRDGILYGGSSIMKAGVSLFNRVFLNNHAIVNAAINPKRYIETSVRPGREKIPSTRLGGMNAAIMRA